MQNRKRDQRQDQGGEKPREHGKHKDMLATTRQKTGQATDASETILKVARVSSKLSQAILRPLSPILRLLSHRQTTSPRAPSAWLDPSPASLSGPEFHA